MTLEIVTPKLFFWILLIWSSPLFTRYCFPTFITFSPFINSWLYILEVLPNLASWLVDFQKTGIDMAGNCVTQTTGILSVSCERPFCISFSLKMYNIFVQRKLNTYYSNVLKLLVFFLCPGWLKVMLKKQFSERMMVCWFQLN